MLGKMDCDGLTDVGRVRETNEDQYLIASLSKSLQIHGTSLDLDEQTRLFGPSQGRLLLVADGMGGHASGERASRLAVDALAAYVLNTLPWFFRLREDREDHFAEDLRAALEYCQSQIEAEAQRVPARRGMGTTVTLAYLVWPRLFVVHVGDSRCYLLRQSRLHRVTRDHTLAQRLVEQGALDNPEDSRWSHLLWNVVGGGTHDLRPEVYRGDLALGDTLLLCTDGLTRYVTDAQIADFLALDVPSKETCRQLVAAANDAGGADNVTVVVARFRDVAHHQKVATTAEVVPAKARAREEERPLVAEAVALAQ